MEPKPQARTSDEVIVLLVSGTCCVPQLSVVDQQAQQIIRQASADTGIAAQVRTLTISSALRGGVPMEILKSSGVAIDATNIMRLPAVLIDSRLVSFGVPKLDVVKNALMGARNMTHHTEGAPE